jgi:hypothetical protein
MGKVGERGQTKGSGAQSEGGGVDEKPPIDAAEHLAMELARLRAKFGVDPAVERTSFEDAWRMPAAGTEEDEAEFIDAVADCLSVGLSLDAALACWDAGGASSDDASEEDGDDGLEPSFLSAAHPQAKGRRVLIE